MSTDTHRILVADDEPALLELSVLWLKSAGFEVVEALDGIAALQIMENTSFDALVLDILMPRLDGISRLAAVRERGITTPAIFASSQADRATRTRATRLGAVGFLLKPVRGSEMIDAVRAAVSDRPDIARATPIPSTSDAVRA
jgi:DNA-binding response OmpR family regulator